MVFTDCKMSRRKAACLGGIDFTSCLKDGAAADLVLVILDRTARQQIDLAAENILDFLVKIKEVPAEMNVRLEGDQKVDIAAAMRLAACEGAEHFEPGHTVPPAKGREPGLDLVQGRGQCVVRRNHGGLSISSA